MKKSLERNVVLAIECAVGGGSLSLLEDSEELDSFVFRNASSKAEDLLEEISAILKRNLIDKKFIRKIVCSDGTGSRTGIRIGKATAAGLKSALACETAEVSILEALTLKLEKVEKNENCRVVQTAHQISVQNVFRQIFKKNSRNTFFKKGLPEEISIDGFLKEIPNFDQTIFLSKTEDVSEKDFGVLSGKLKVLSHTENIARLIGFYASET
jgi:tRNA A37 threonylcarbamoyladenosine modification protein TsaB